MKRVILGLAVILVVAILASVALIAGSVQNEPGVAGDWVEHPNGMIGMRLVSSVEAVGSLEEIRLGLQFRMDPGWKIYWRSPGAAGAPPEAEWTESANLEAVDISWPAPSRFTTFDLQTHGYGEEVVFPLSVRPLVPGETVELRAAVDYFACNEVCIPGDGMLALDLPPGEPRATPDAALIDQYRARVPVAAGILGIEMEEALLSPAPEPPGGDPAQGGGMLFRLTISSQQALAAPDVFVEGPIHAFFDKPEFALSADGRQATATLRTTGASPAELTQKPLLVTLTDGERAVEQAVEARLVDTLPPLPAELAAPATSGRGLSIWWILGFALLGGLILNLMPCVLPVLSLKFLSVLGHGGRENTHVRLGFLASVAGILTSFLLLAGILAGLKAAGATIGWGIQFQQPVFLAVMVVIVTLFAANLFGLFEIILPRRIADLIAIDTGDRHEHHHSLGGHFLTGAFAALLATPCSAPFLGTAVGFALSRGTAEIFLVFGALGLGLAAPYLTIAAFPGLATRLPRPGAWMGTLKKILGLLLAATAVWLVTVIAAETGRDVALGIGGLAAAMVAVFWARGLEGSRLGRHAGKVAALLAVVIVAAPVLAPRSVDSGASRVVDDAVWRNFDQAELRRLVADGKTVLVDVTADWCITCQVNKAAVLNRDPVASLLADGTIVAMRADWTLPSQEIADYLASFGRYGIPFNAVYGPNAPGGIALNEILVTGSVMAALEQAGGMSGIAAK